MEQSGKGRGRKLEVKWSLERPQEYYHLKDKGRGGGVCGIFNMTCVCGIVYALW